MQTKSMTCSVNKCKYIADPLIKIFTKAWEMHLKLLAIIACHIAYNFGLMRWVDYLIVKVFKGL